MIQQNTFLQANRIISINELSQLLSKSRVTIWRLTRDGIIPKPIKIGSKTLGWRTSIILEWLETQEVA